MEEIEAKYRLAGEDDHTALRARLISLGARPGGRVHEQNVLFDRPDESLTAADRVLRLRVLDGGPAGRLTYKGPAQQRGGLKRRTELETAVDQARTTRALLEGLGYAPRLEYCKERETWHLQAAEVALDRLEFGYYCEIEGSEEAVRRVAAALDLRPDQIEPASYPALQARHQAHRLA